MNALENLVQCLQVQSPEIVVPEPIRQGAVTCIERMLDFVGRHPEALSRPVQGFVPSQGAA